MMDTLTLLRFALLASLAVLIVGLVVGYLRARGEPANPHAVALVFLAAAIAYSTGEAQLDGTPVAPRVLVLFVGSLVANAAVYTPLIYHFRNKENP